MKSLKGHLLLAAPSLVDPNFRRALVLILQHDENGAMGLVVNRTTKMTIAEAWTQVSEEACEIDSPLYKGGPCEDRLLVLHSVKSMSQMEIIDGLYCTTDSADVAWLVKNKADPIKFFVGYAGWQSGQLEYELTEKAWLIAPAQPAQIFQTPSDAWTAITRSLSTTRVFPGVDPKLIPRDPSLN